MECIKQISLKVYDCIFKKDNQSINNIYIQNENTDVGSDDSSSNSSEKDKNLDESNEKINIDKDDLTIKKTSSNLNNYTITIHLKVD